MRVYETPVYLSPHTHVKVVLGYTPHASYSVSILWEFPSTSTQMVDYLGECVDEDITVAGSFTVMVLIGNHKRSLHKLKAFGCGKCR